MPIPATIMIVDDTPANIGVLFDTLSRYGHKVLVAKDGESALRKIQQEFPDLVLLDVMMPGMDGFEVCRRLKADEQTGDIPVIFMTALNQPEEKVRAFEAGAVDFISKPFSSEEVQARVSTHLRLRSLQEDLQTELDCRIRAEKQLKEVNSGLEAKVEERTRELSSALREVELLKNRLQGQVSYLEEELQREHNFGDIVGKSPALHSVLEKVALVAPSDTTVLVTGESGTGKELIARAIHQASNRREGPMIKVNCGAIAPTLVESELFGHEKGAFTGAVKERKGRFELAHQGTLFLDEIGELSPDIQVKLLRVLQEGEFERLGGTETIRVSVRVICATHVNLADKVAKETFRDDLYYRLNVFPVEVPPLRSRKEDIPLLAEHFLHLFAAKTGRHVRGIAPQVMEQMLAYGWPGNIRELQNALERAVLLATGPLVDSADFLPQTVRMPSETRSAEPLTLDSLEELERRIYRDALNRARWKIAGEQGAAALLGRPVSTVRDRVKKLGLTPQ